MSNTIPMKASNTFTQYFHQLLSDKSVPDGSLNNVNDFLNIQNKNNSKCNSKNKIIIQMIAFINQLTIELVNQSINQ